MRNNICVLNDCYKKLIEKAKEIKISNDIETNFFEVCGFPNYEHVVSNVLKFFFNDREEHGFGNLWLKSLLSAYKQKINPDIYSVFDIYREYSDRDTTKRIDVLIDCGDLLLVIENKIYADLYNDLDEYSSIAERYAKQKEIDKNNILKIVLSLNPVSKDELKLDFINITYDELFEEIEKTPIDNIANQKWAIFQNEFIKNLKSRREDTNMKLNEKWIELVNDNKKDVKHFIGVFEDDLKNKKKVLSFINKYIGESELKVERHGVYDSSYETYMSQYNDTRMSNGDILTIESYFMKKPTGNNFENYSTLYVCLWNRTRHVVDEYEELVKTFNDHFKKHTSCGWKEQFVLDEIDFLKEQNIEEIAKIIREYILKISS